MSNWKSVWRQLGEVREVLGIIGVCAVGLLVLLRVAVWVMAGLWRMLQVTWELDSPRWTHVLATGCLLGYAFATVAVMVASVRGAMRLTTWLAL